MKLVRTFGFGLGAVAFFLACSSDDVSPSKAGLALTVATDGSVAPDRVSVKVSSASSVFYDSELSLGASAQLPKTLSIGASGTATVVVQAWSGSTPLDRRDLTLATLPTDSFATYTVLLSGRCTAHVHAAADGSIASDCAAGTTCDPATGACGSAAAVAQVPDAGPTSCTPAATKCSADGLSVETCNPDGASFGAGTSCNGKTCENGACTTTNAACTAGAKRCGTTDSLVVEQCDATGAWSKIDKCQNLCRDGACIGECVPGNVACCDDEIDINTHLGIRRCADLIDTCVGGPGCGGGTPPATKVYLTLCDANGKRQEINDCFAAGGSVGNPGTANEVQYARCGACPTTGSASCLDIANGNTCAPIKSH